MGNKSKMFSFKANLTVLLLVEGLRLRTHDPTTGYTATSTNSYINLIMSRGNSTAQT